MGNKTVNLGETVKTYSFKVENSNGVDINTLCEAISEYQEYYNKTSEWIKEHLQVPIGSLMQYIPEEKRSMGYAQVFNEEEWKNKPLYELFKTKLVNHRNNFLFNVINTCCADNYKDSNILNFNPTEYRRFGYFLEVMSNYASKFSKMQTGVRRHKLSDAPTEHELTEQTIYEMERHGLVSIKEWERYIKNIKNVSTSADNSEYIERIQTLFEYYRIHENDVNSKKDMMVVDFLTKFNACHRRDDKKSMKIMGTTSTKFNITQIEHNRLNIQFGKSLNLDVYGRQDVIKNNKMLVDVTSKHGQSFVLKINEGDIYIDITCTIPFSKKIASINNVVGVDVNVKHMLLATNIIDNGNIDGYVNIYKEAISDKEFRAVCDDETLKLFSDYANFVTFCPIEFNMLWARFCERRGIKDEFAKMEVAFSKVLSNLKKRFLDMGDVERHIYVSCIWNLRSKLNSYVILKNVYNEQQGIYDKGKEQEYIQEHPFSNTENGVGLIRKMKSVSQDIIGCRNNILQYAYQIFKKNGNDMIGLEKLTTSQFKKEKGAIGFPTVNSILNFYHILGCTEEEMKERKIYSIIKKGYYNFTYDNNGSVIDATLSEEAQMKALRNTSFNLMIKALHFANIKDYFITLSNNGSVGVALVPPAYTSQMDSIDHKICCTKDLKPLPKEAVRKKQEYHTNGLPADFNAAVNIAHTVSNEKFRNMFLKVNTTPLYNEPSYDVLKNIKSENVFLKLKKEKMTKIIAA